MKFPSETSAADRVRPSTIALLLANLVPVAGVFIFHWEVFPLMFLFWSENVIIGGFNVLKMLTANPESPVGEADKSKCAATKSRTVIESIAELLRQPRKSVLIPFFCMHYGIGTFLHGVFVIGFFGGGFKTGSGFPFPETFWRIMRESHLGWAILGLAISRGISFATNYLGRVNTNAPACIY